MPTKSWKIIKMSNIKQVIVIRKDLKMRRGKEIAQGAHASMAFMSHAVREFFVGPCGYTPQFTQEQKDWINGNFAKVALQVDSETELLSIYEKAKEARLTVNLITDAGLTEFGGVATHTCLAIGPHYAEKIDPITSHLKLY